MVLAAVGQVDPSSSGKCQLMTGRLLHLADQLKLTSLLVTVWQYQIEQGRYLTVVSTKPNKTPLVGLSNLF